MFAAPQAKPGQAGAEDEFAQYMGPPQPLGATKFQQSVNSQRASDANKAATFAASAPLPMAPGKALPNVGRGGGYYEGEEEAAKPVYDGAFGKGPQAQKQAEAARAAFVADQSAKANLNSNNFYANKGYADDANTRQNAENAATVGLAGSQMRGNDAVTNLLVPAQAAHLGAQTGAVTGAEHRADLLVPQTLEQLRLGNQATTQRNALDAQFAAPLLKSQLERGTLENQRYGQETPAVVAGAGEAAANSAALNKRMHELLQQEMQLNKQKYEAQPPPADPNADLERQGKQLDLYKKAGRDDLIKGMFPQPLQAQQMPREQIQAAFDARAARRAGAEVPPEAVKAVDDHPEGVTATSPDGTRWLKKNGQWVPQS